MNIIRLHELILKNSSVEEERKGGKCQTLVSSLACAVWCVCVYVYVCTYVLCVLCYVHVCECIYHAWMWSPEQDLRCLSLRFPRFPILLPWEGSLPELTTCLVREIHYPASSWGSPPLSSMQRFQVLTAMPNFCFYVIFTGVLGIWIQVLILLKQVVWFVFFCFVLPTESSPQPLWYVF